MPNRAKLPRAELDHRAGDRVGGGAEHLWLSRAATMTNSTPASTITRKWMLLTVSRNASQVSPGSRRRADAAGRARRGAGAAPRGRRRAARSAVASPVGPVSPVWRGAAGLALQRLGHPEAQEGAAPGPPPHRQPDQPVGQQHARAAAPGGCSSRPTVQYSVSRSNANDAERIQQGGDPAACSPASARRCRPAGSRSAAAPRSRRPRASCGSARPWRKISAPGSAGWAAPASGRDPGRQDPVGPDQLVVQERHQAADEAAEPGRGLDDHQHHQRPQEAAAQVAALRTRAR